MKIAIIGSGVSGLVSAYLLSPYHEVILYEKSDRLGGHAHTLFVKNGKKEIPVDNGFMVYNPERYPNFVKLLEELHITSVETQMTFGVTILDRISYRGDFIGLISQPKNLLQLDYWKMLYNIARFQKIAKKVLKENTHPEDTLEQFLKRYKFGKTLEWFLYPLLAAVWSIKDTDTVDDFPALSTFTFLNNHKLLDSKHPRWRTIKGGSIQYVTKIKKYLEKHNVSILLKTHITAITRQKDTVTIETKKGKQQFDYVIFATHADTTSTLITDKTKEESQALGLFTYTKNTTVLHGDTSLTPTSKNLLAAWNVKLLPSASTKPLAVFTYCMNILQHIPQSFPLFVTLNSPVAIDKTKMYATEEYMHPTYTKNTLKGQKMINDLQGNRRTFYTGAHLGYGFHEDGVVSAINVAKKLGVVPPWDKN